MKNRKWSQFALGLASVVPLVVSAQDKGGGLEEIVVTAQRREESIQDVPLAVTALSADQLQSAGIVNMTQLSGHVPSLVVVPGGTVGRQIPVFSIRGQSNQEYLILNDPSVSLYFNDVPVSRTHGANMSFFDLQSIEVLKGPQGTLFGRNTTGGAVLVRPNKPVDEFEASVSQMFGNLGTMETEAVLNVPVAEWGSLRLAGQHREDDGYIEDVLTGKKVNYTDQNAGRISFDIRPNDRVESLFVAGYAKALDGGTGAHITLLPGGVSAGLRAVQAPLLAAQQQLGRYEIASGVPMFVDVSNESIDNTTTVQLTDSVVVKNIIGYRDIDYRQLEDSDGSSGLILSVGGIQKTHLFSEELQLQGSNSWLDWITGAFYFNEEGRSEGPSAGLATGAGTPDPGLIEPFKSLYDYCPRCVSTISNGENTSKAIFAQGTFDLAKVLDGLSLTVGGRQTWDQRDAVIQNIAFLNPPAVPVAALSCRFTVDSDNNPATPNTRPSLDDCRLPLSKKFKKFTYNISLDYKINSDALVYLAHRLGYRSGGWGPRATSQQALERPFQPETVSDYELGAKVDWHIGNTYLRTNIAVYHADYKDIQRQLLDPTLIPVSTVTSNAGKAKIDGAEFEFVFRPIDVLEFSGFYSYTDARFTQFIAPDGSDLSKAPFARAPENVYGATGRVVFPTSLGELSGSANFSHIDDYVVSDTYDPDAWSEGYDLWNFDVQLAGIAGSGADVSLFVQNAFDKKYMVTNQHIFQINHTEYPGQPRTYGVRLRYRFGER